MICTLPDKDAKAVPCPVKGKASVQEGTGGMASESYEHTGTLKCQKVCASSKLS